MKKKLLTITITIATLLLAGVAIFTAVRIYQLRNQPISPANPSSKPAAFVADASTFICKRGTADEFKVRVSGDENTNCSGTSTGNYYEQCLAGTTSKFDLSTYSVKYKVDLVIDPNNPPDERETLKTSVKVKVTTNWCSEPCGQDLNSDPNKTGALAGGCWSNQKQEDQVATFGTEYTVTRTADPGMGCGSYQIDILPMYGEANNPQPCYASSGFGFVCVTGLTCDAPPTATPPVSPTPNTPTPTSSPIACTALTFKIAAVTPTPTASGSVAPTPTPTPTSTPVSCNNTCSLKSDCESGLVCTSGSCRNPSCNSQTNCTCPTPTATPTAKPLVSCNNGCTDHTDCASGLVCYSGACRNPNCTNITNCTCPITTTTQEPEPELPNAGTSLPTILGISAGVFMLIIALALAL